MKRISDLEFEQAMQLARNFLGLNPNYFEFNEFLSNICNVFQLLGYATSDFQTIAWELWYTTKEEPNNGHG